MIIGSCDIKDGRLIAACLITQIIVGKIVPLGRFWAQNFLTTHRGNLRKVRLLNQSNPLRYIANASKYSKNKAKTFCCISPQIDMQ